MNGVLRTALAYFSMLPFQRWLNGVGFLLLAFGAIQFSSDDIRSGGTGFAFTLTGVIALSLMPAFGGGIALRFASTPTLLHLMPHGRVRAMLGSMLAITLIAALVTLPFLGMEWFMASPGRSVDPHYSPPLEAFLVSWPLVAVGWILIFAVSRSLLVWAVMGLMPMAVMSAGQAIGSALPDAHWMFVAGLASWAAFAIWYLRTDTVIRPAFPLMSGGSDTSTPPLGRLLSQVGATSGPASRPQGLLQYLFGCASPLFFVLNGAWIAAVFIVVQLFTMGSLFQRTDPLLTMMPYIAFLNAGLGFNAARRARFLWLRTDLDRKGLFSLVERLGLRYSMMGWFTACALLMVSALIDRPELTTTLLLYFALQATAAMGVFYGCLALTESWSVRDVALCIVLAVLMIAQMLIAQPRRDPSIEVVTWALVAAAAILVALRAYAGLRWRALDWRVAKVSRASMGIRT
jgi:hypothetical protein